MTCSSGPRSRARVALAATGAVAAYALAVRPRLRHLGATPSEAVRALPGDDLVAAMWDTTRATSIATSAEQVWPWLVQMGFGRGGWYSYDWLERLGGVGDFVDGGSAARVVPALQSLQAGDPVALSADNAFTVAVLEPQRALVLHLGMNLLTGRATEATDRTALDWTWAFVLEPCGPDACRLVVRVRAACRPRAFGLLVPLLLEPVHLVMELKMLRTIKQRAESAAAAAA